MLLKRPLRPAVRFRWTTRKWDYFQHERSIPFPERFLWGAATSSHQVEGDNPDSDWWEHERTHPIVKNFSNFPSFAQRYKSDHWRQLEADADRMRDELHLSAYRFSIEWSRVEPREGEFDEKALRRYAKFCARLRANGITPLVTLFHWSSPAWIWEKDKPFRSGWYDKRIVGRFQRYVKRVVEALKPHVDLFATLNEPNIFLYGGYSEGLLAPGHQRPDTDLLCVQRNLFRAHVAAWETIKRIHADAKVGIAHQFCPFEPVHGFNPLEALVTARVEQSFTWSFPDALRDGFFWFATRDGTYHREPVEGLKGTADFMGVNFYESMRCEIGGGYNIRDVRIRHDHHESKEIWPQEINTRGFSDMLRRVYERYGLPIYVTENGQAHPDDEARSRFVREHLKTLGEVVQSGVDVRGYFYWSLLDNLEWANGFVPRLGLYEVNYANGERKLRRTGLRYGRTAKKNRYEPEDWLRDA